MRLEEVRKEKIFIYKYNNLKEMETHKVLMLKANFNIEYEDDKNIFKCYDTGCKKYILTNKFE